MVVVKTNNTEESVIFSDYRKAFNTKELKDAGYEYFSSNHGYNFVVRKVGGQVQNLSLLGAIFFSLA